MSSYASLVEVLRVGAKREVCRVSFKIKSRTPWSAEEKDSRLITELLGPKAKFLAARHRSIIGTTDDETGLLDVYTQ